VQPPVYAQLGIGAWKQLTPTWAELLGDLALEANILPEEQSEFDRLDYLDKARIIASRFQRSGIDFRDAVAERLKVSRYGLGHSLLASLPVNEIVTTNYDTLFERASRDAERPLTVLPYEPDPDQKRWLLKLHGCVEHTGDIVLTREDYLGYAEHRGALVGIVQALLVTRHMLFVGFSLTDDNFHRLVHDVRQALSPTPQDGPVTHFGTSLQLLPGKLLQELWEEDIDCLRLGELLPSPDLAGASRLQDIFLDYLLALSSSNTDHLLEDTFSGALSDDEQELRAELVRFTHGVTTGAHRAPASKKVEQLLAELGDPHSAAIAASAHQG
jgi:SIR2-like domain